MPFESPATVSVPQEKPPELPKSEKEEFSVFKELTNEELAILQEKIETVERNILFAQSRKDEAMKEKALDDLREVISENPQFVRAGLHYSDTYISTLQIINAARDLVRQRDDSPTHFSTREITKQEQLITEIESVIIESEEDIRKVLRDKNDTTRDSTLGMLSSMLDSSNKEHREYSESMLMEYLPLAQELFFHLPKVSRKEPLVRMWQEMFLRMEKPEHLREVWSEFKLMWEIKKEKNWDDLYNNVLRKMFSVFDKAFKFNKDFVLKSAVDLAGLDGSKMMKQWMQAGDESQEKEHGPGHQYAYTQNLKVLYELKQESSVAPSELYRQFGITHFGRYTKEMLLRQYEERDEKKPYGIVLFPMADHNGAFFSSNLHLDRVQNMLGESHALRAVEVSSKQDIARTLVRLNEKYASNNGHKIEFAVIGGHGTKNNISFGEGRDERDRVTIDDLAGAGMNRGVAQFFEPGAEIVLVSCSTGVDDGIAKEMSQQFGWHVSAPDNDTNLEFLNVRFENEKPVFEVVYGAAGNGVVKTKVFGSKK